MKAEIQESAVDSLAGADALIVVGERHDIFAHLSSGQAPAVLPGKGVASAIVIAQRIANRIIGVGSAAIRNQQIAPSGMGQGDNSSPLSPMFFRSVNQHCNQIPAIFWEFPLRKFL